MQVDSVISLLGVSPLHVGNVSERSLGGLNEISWLESNRTVDLELSKLVGDESLLSSGDSLHVEADRRSMSSHEDFVSHLDASLRNSSKDEVVGLDRNNVESGVLAKRGHQSLSQVLLDLLSRRDFEKRADVLGRERKVVLQLSLPFEVVVDQSLDVLEVCRFAHPGDGLDLEEDK